MYNLFKSHFRISTSLNKLLTLKLAQKSLPKSQVCEQLTSITSNIDPSDFEEFRQLYQQFDYQISNLAEIFNQNLDASNLLKHKYKQVEASAISDLIYEKLMNANQSEPIFSSHSLINLQGLNNQGELYLQSITGCDSKQKAIDLIVKDSSFIAKYLYCKTCKVKSPQFQIELESLSKEILQESDYNVLLAKFYLFQTLQISNFQIIDYFCQETALVSSNAINSKGLVIFTYILVEQINKNGYSNKVSNLMQKLDTFISKIDLNLVETNFVLKMISSKVDIPSKFKLCEAINQNYKQLSLFDYTQCFQALCNNYWANINLDEHKQHILDHFDELTNEGVIQILRGLTWAESNDKDLYVKLLDKVSVYHSPDQRQLKWNCSLYQIMYTLDKLYNIQYPRIDMELLKSHYYHKVNFMNNNSYSYVELEINELLKQFQANSQTWRITKVERQAMVGLYSIDFQIHIEGIYRKKIILLDVIGGSNFNAKSMSGKLRLRTRLLHNEDLKIVSITQWNQEQNKKEFLKQLLAI